MKSVFPFSLCFAESERGALVKLSEQSIVRIVEFFVGKTYLIERIVDDSRHFYHILGACPKVRVSTVRMPVVIVVGIFVVAAVLIHKLCSDAHIYRNRIAAGTFKKALRPFFKSVSAIYEKCGVGDVAYIFNRRVKVVALRSRWKKAHNLGIFADQGFRPYRKAERTSRL